MVSIPVATIVHIASPFIAAIITDIVQSSVVKEELSGIRQRFYQGMCEITSKTSFTLDDILVAACAEALTNNSVYQKGGSIIIDAIESWVKSTDTKWDDTLVLPIIDTLRNTAEQTQ